jgi:hypothetical protein
LSSLVVTVAVPVFVRIVLVRWELQAATATAAHINARIVARFIFDDFRAY